MDAIMKITSRASGGALYLYLDGEIDECTVAELRRAADELIDFHAAAKKGFFNLAGVRFMDSTGIGFLIGRYKKIARYGGKMCLENPNVSADKVLAVSGVYTLIPKI